MPPSLRPVLILPLAWLALAGRPSAQDVEGRPVFDWDLISLEQNSQRFNGSVLSGFHNLRSPGVTPRRAWKAGLGLIYSQEDQVASTIGTESVFSMRQLIINPKLNYGLAGSVEIGAGVEANWVEGKDVHRTMEGDLEEKSEENANLSAAVAGVKWAFLRLQRLRLGLAFDSRIAVHREQFGMLPITLFNGEVDAEYFFTSRFSLISNLQIMTSDDWNQVRDQLIFDAGGAYTFSDRFRGIIFLTVQEDDPANTAIIFIGFAGQYLFLDRHSIALAVDFQVNDATRDVRTQGQIDLELSYTFTF